MSQKDSTPTKEIKAPGAVTPRWCVETFGKKGLEIYRRIANAGGFGDFHGENSPALDLTGAGAETLAKIEKIIQESK